VRIEDQAVAFSVAVEGPPDSKGNGLMVVYDAVGTERSRTDLGELVPGQRWDALLDLPVGSLADGDYAVWVFVGSEASDGSFGKGDQKGASFLVGRGRVYPSTERAAARGFAAPPTLSPMRLEGTWIVFDMTNAETYDVAVTYQVSISQPGGTTREFHSTELLRPRATQQGHQLLPDDLPNGKYMVIVLAQAEGSDFPATVLGDVLIDGAVVTMVP
jgi:hypothetical protein